jgi:SHS2 domain-containing protein
MRGDAPIPEYRKLEHQADVGFVVRAPTWQRLFADAALVVTDLQVPLKNVEEREKRTVTLTAPNREELMVRWINAVLALVDTDRFLARRVVPEKFSFQEISATLHGEIADPVRHGHWSEIKAATYHQLLLEDDPGGGFRARVFLDL